MKEIISCNSESLFIDTAVSSIASRLMKNTREGKIFRLALSGGSTPQMVYKKLAEKEDIDWSLVEIYLVDERYIPQTDKESNCRLINESLIKNLSEKVSKFIYFDTKQHIPEVLKKYEKNLDKDNREFFDLIILGLGEDGHTASLFPKGEELQEKKSWVVQSQTNKHQIKDRLTLTYPALESSKEIFFLIKGKNKAEIIDKVQVVKKTDKCLPAARLWHTDKTKIFYGEF